MPSIRHSWTRFWAPQSQILSCDRFGFFQTPDTQNLLRVNERCIELAALESARCLVLLGEPGSGKSHELSQEAERCQNSLVFNLRAFNNRSDLHQIIFENPTLLEWKNAVCEEKGEPTLTLFLDSMDEGLIETGNLALILEEELRALPLERLKLRISCRTSEWPHSFSAFLREAWKEFAPEAVQFYELAPLRREDVALAATDWGIDSERFLDAIEKRGGVALALSPVTLAFLLRLARESQSNNDFELPASRETLYRKGLLHLCAESDAREDAGHAGNLRPEEKLALAARLAALSIFGGHAAIYYPRNQRLELEPPAQHSNELQLSHALGGDETTENGVKIGATPENLRETLNTGLFKGRGEASLSWTHQTFAEFLAADWVVRRGMTLPQIISLFTAPEGGFVPQLTETAAWLATRHFKFREWLLDFAPDVFQHSDVALLDGTLRVDIVEALLRAIDVGKMRASAIDFKQAAKLAHPSLETQLKNWLENRNRSQNARIGATELAGICRVELLAPILAALALDGNEAKPMRFYAGSALLALAETGRETSSELVPVVAESLQKLLPLAKRRNGDGSPTDDPTDDLKALGLRAIWPQSASIAEVLGLLDVPDENQGSQDYERFISYELARHLQLHHLPAALRWARQQENLAASGQGSRIRRLASKGRIHQEAPSKRGFLMGEICGQNLFEDIARLAWEHFSHPGVARAFARLLLTRQNHHKEIFGRDDWIVAGQTQSRPPFETLLHQQTPEAVAKRRKLVREIGRIMSDWRPDEPEHPNWSAGRELLFGYGFQLIGTADKEWLRQRAENPDVSPKARHLAAWLLAQQQEKESGSDKWYDWSPPEPRFVEPPPLERIERDLQDFESGDLAAWGRLNFDLSLAPEAPMNNINGTWRPNNDEKKVKFGDLMRLPAWETLLPALCERVLKAALEFLEKATPYDEIAPPYDYKTGNYAAWQLGYRALRLLVNSSPHRAAQLTPQLWKKWAGAVVNYDPGETMMKTDPHALMVRRALEDAPQETLSAFEQIWNQDLKRFGSLLHFGSLSECWNSTERARLETFLLQFLRRSDLPADSQRSVRHTLFNALFKHDVAEAESFAWEITLDESDQSSDARDNRLQVAVLLLLSGRKGAWAKIWPLVERKQIEGRELADRCACQRIHEGKELTALSPLELEQIYGLLRRYVRPERDRGHLGVKRVTTRRHVENLRDAVFSFLGQRGTLEDLAAMQRLCAQFSHDEKLKEQLHQARLNRHRRTWQPIEAKHLLELARDPERRVVRNGEELLEVLEASLQRLEIKLQKGTPAAVNLWSELKWSQVTKIFAHHVKTNFPNLLGLSEALLESIKRATKDSKSKTDAIFLVPRDETRLSDYLKRHFDSDLKQRHIVVNREVEVHPASTGVGTRTDLWVEIAGDNGPIRVVVEVKGCWHPEVRTAMQIQLRDEYLSPLNERFGLYVVGWFECDDWCQADSRRDKVPKIAAPKGKKSRPFTMDEMKNELQTQAHQLSDEQFRLRSFVLDVRWPLKS